jgi:hypothetical protein
MRRTLLLVLLASSSGCAIFPIQYKEPLAGSVASIRFKNESIQPVTTYVFETSHACTGRRKVGELAPQAEITRKVPADADLTFQYYLHRKGTDQYCLVNLRFSPKGEGQYVFSAVDDPLYCRWSMVDVTDPARPAVVKLQKLERDKAWDENSAWCRE